MSKENKKSEKKKKQKRTPLEKFFGFLHFWERHLFRVVFPYKRYGNLTKYNEGPLIVIGNHYSVLDVVYPCLLTDRPIHFMAKQELWKGGMMKKFVIKCECIPVKRDGSDVQAIKDAMRYLKNDGVVNIFPEGTRNRSYADLLPFHGGAAALSIKMKAPIVPIVQVKKLKAFHKSHIIYGDPIEFRQFYDKKVTKEDIEACDKQLRDAIINMRLAFIEKHNIKFKSDKV